MGKLRLGTRCEVPGLAMRQKLDLASPTKTPGHQSTEPDNPQSHAPTVAGCRGPSLPAQGHSVPVASGLSPASRAGSRPEKRGQLWGTGPRRASTAAITSGLERAAGGAGREPGLISRPGTRAGAGAAAAEAVQARPRQAGREEAASGRPGKAWAEEVPQEQACGPSSSVPPGAAIRGFQSLSLIGFIFAS